MSEVQTSREDKFFGVSYQVETPDEEPETKEASNEVELEIIDGAGHRLRESPEAGFLHSTAARALYGDGLFSGRLSEGSLQNRN